VAASSSQPVLVYADGSCEGNPGPGGWGIVIVTPQGTRRLSGGDSQTTNNRMEIMAAIEALRAIDPGVPVILRSDSQYLVKTMNEGWRRTKNQDLWKQLDAEVARHNVRFEWVRGHAGDALNEEADELAREAARIAASSRAPRRPAIAGAATAAPERTAGRGGLPRSSGSFDDEVDELILEKLEPMLGPDERIAKCDVCKQAFVARGDEKYCSLVACQLVRRKIAP
jgi:ribonuclease HI